MKIGIKNFVLLVLFAIGVPFIVSAQIRSTGQIGIGYISQSLNFPGDKIDAQALGLSGMNLAGEDIGFLSAYNMGFMQSLSENGAAVSLSSYSMKLAFDCLFGIGGTFHLVPNLDLVVGGGFHMADVILSSSDYTVSSFVALTVGAGVLASAHYFFTPNLGVGLGCEVAYDFNAPITTASNKSLTSGLTLAPSLGLVYKF